MVHPTSPKQAKSAKQAKSSSQANCVPVAPHDTGWTIRALRFRVRGLLQKRSGRAWEEVWRGEEMTPSFSPVPSRLLFASSPSAASAVGYTHFTERCETIDKRSKPKLSNRYLSLGFHGVVPLLLRLLPLLLLFFFCCCSNAFLNTTKPDEARRAHPHQAHTVSSDYNGWITTHLSPYQNNQ